MNAVNKYNSAEAIENYPMQQHAPVLVNYITYM